MKYLTTSLEDIPWVRHGFFTRVGGVSGGVYNSLNCGPGSGDDLDSVWTNRERVAEALGIAQLATTSQIHSARAVMLTEPWEHENRPDADAIVTATRGVGIGVLTADCTPILFASRKDKIVGSAHAGWKGALGGVLEATTEAMKNLGAKTADISAAIGPCIGPLSYEVSDDFINPFLEHDKSSDRFFRKAEKPGHLMFDLPGYVSSRLKAAGIETIHDTKQDTLPNEAAWFSYRRTTQRKEKDYGRQISVIAIK